MDTILTAKQIDGILSDITEKINHDLNGCKDLVVIGIRSRGEILAQRLASRLSQPDHPVQCGVLDITLYRDDLNDPHGLGQPEVRTTEIHFDINDQLIILVDDVLFTGRSTRAALDALIDLGRPRAIRLAVLVERNGREFPIQADYVGFRTTVRPDQRIAVKFVECDGVDAVTLE